MIVEIQGQLTEVRDQSVILNVQGMYYEVYVPASVKRRLNDLKDAENNVHLKVYHYLQIGPSAGFPILVGFINDIEKDFFQHFIKVSGIGPRAAVRALAKPISDITQAIEIGDVKFLKTLPGIGAQKAKEIVAKLQGKIGKFGLIQDRISEESFQPVVKTDFHEEALDVLLQLQYTKVQAEKMIAQAVERNAGISSAEDLLNEIYKQKVQ